MANTSQGRRGRLPAGALLLLALTCASYLPALRGGYVWDDEAHITQNRALWEPGGLARIWRNPLATPQYYPAVHTVFWLEYLLWGLRPLGYHAVNILLHATNALLLWLVLRRLALPGGFLAALLFALHPVQVESVAWITELKNVLSGFFFFLSLLGMMRFCGLGWPAPRLKTAAAAYACAAACFLLALLSKTVTATLPAVMVVLLWWKRGRVTWREGLALAPFFALGAVAGLMTAGLEKLRVGAIGPDWDFTPAERVLIAGRALWFYAGKLAWPHPLAFIYPRWNLNPAAAQQWIFPAAALATVALLWWFRRRLGRGPLAAVLIFGGTLFPALGFFNVYPMRYSFVADHFQYLAGAALLAGFAAIVASITPPWPGTRGARALVGAGAALVLTCGSLTWRQGAVYKDLETLWQDTLAKNPTSWMAWNNLGLIYMERGDFKAAQAHYDRALELKPDFDMPYFNKGTMEAQRNNLEDAVAYYRRTLALNPRYEPASLNLGIALFAQGKTEEALQAFQKVLAINPANPDARYNAGLVLERQDNLRGAEQAYRGTLRYDAFHERAAYHLGLVLKKMGRTDEAIAQHIQTLALYPRHAPSHYELGVLLLGQGMKKEAVRHFQSVLQSETNHPGALNNLAWIMATSREPDVHNSAEALQLALRAAAASTNENLFLLDTLSAAYAAGGRFDDAVRTAEQAARLADRQGATNFQRDVGRRLEKYRRGQPWTE